MPRTVQVLVVTNGDGKSQRFALRNSALLKYEQHTGTSFGAKANTDGFRMAYWFVNRRWPTEAELSGWVDTITVDAETEEVPDADADPTDHAPAPSL